MQVSVSYHCLSPIMIIWGILHFIRRSLLPLMDFNWNIYCVFIKINQSLYKRVIACRLLWQWKQLTERQRSITRTGGTLEAMMGGHTGRGHVRHRPPQWAEPPLLWLSPPPYGARPTMTNPTSPHQWKGGLVLRGLISHHPPVCLYAGLIHPWSCQNWLLHALLWLIHGLNSSECTSVIFSYYYPIAFLNPSWISVFWNSESFHFEMEAILKCSY